MPHRLYPFRRWPALAALCAVFVLTGCTPIVHAKRDGEKLVAAMHTAMGRGDWKGIYDAADPKLRAGTPEDRFGALFVSIATKLGSPVSFTATEWNVDRDSDGIFLRSTCETKFSNHASGTETFEWRRVGRNFLLFSYHIKSEQLMTK